MSESINDDISNDNEYQYCSDIIDNNPEYCSKYNGKYCQLSCYQCQYESNIFGEIVRGRNGIRYDRPEKLPELGDGIDNDNGLSDDEYCTTTHPSDHSGNILFISDIHVEPWYNIDGSGEVSRFSGANINNMFECRNSDGHQVNCTLNHNFDPPINLFKTCMQYLGNHISNPDLSKNILVFAGDTQVLYYAIYGIQIWYYMYMSEYM